MANLTNLNYNSCCEDESNHASAVFYKFVNSFPITVSALEPFQIER